MDVTPQTTPQILPDTAPSTAEVYVFGLPDTEEARDFEALYAFFDGCQHDHAPLHWDGSARQLGVRYPRERYLPRGYVPVDKGSPGARKPDMPTPAAAQIVTRATGMMLGTDPTLICAADRDTQELLRQIWTHGNLRASFCYARNMAGAAQAAVVVPELVGGRPRIRVLKPSECRVLKWSDREVYQPEFLIHQVIVRKVVVEGGKRLEKQFWRTCGWDLENYYEWDLVPKDYPRDQPLPPPKSAVPHGCENMCPATWYRNTEGPGPWGIHDYHQLEPRCDHIDRLGSALVGAVGNNVDPTYYQADDEGTRRRNLMTRKGRGALVQLSDKGRVGAIEIAGTSIQVANTVWRQITEDTFVLADMPRVTPDTAGAYRSGEALRLLWRPAEIKVGLLWTQLADVIRRVMEALYLMACTFKVSTFEDPKEGTIILPAIRRKKPEADRKDMAEVADADRDGDERHVGGHLAQPDEDERYEFVAPKPGRYGYLQVLPGPYFPPTPSDKAQELTALQGASNGAQLFSHVTAISKAAALYGLDPDEERRLIEEEMDHKVDMFDRTSAAGVAEADKEAAEDEAEGETTEPEEEAEGEEPGEDEDNGDGEGGEGDEATDGDMKK